MSKHQIWAWSRETQFSPHLMVADHLSLSLNPVPHCLDTKCCFSSSCYQMLSNGRQPSSQSWGSTDSAEKLGSPAQISQELVSECGQSFCGDSWEDWLFSCRERAVRKSRKDQGSRWWSACCSDEPAIFCLFLGNQIPLLHWGLRDQ